MCIIIDANSLGSVFDKSAKGHEKFKPIFDWIFYGRGKVVFGGSRYFSEIVGKYSALFIELRKANMAVPIDNAKVDATTKTVSKLLKHRDFDDQHLVGLLIVSGCKLICSLDDRAYPFFQHEKFFSPASKRPKIYRGAKKNNELLINKNIADVCQPCRTTTKAQRELINF